jgi:hypothetical protein
VPSLVNAQACSGPQQSVPEPDISCRAYSGRRCDGPCRLVCDSFPGLATLTSDFWEVALGLPRPYAGSGWGRGATRATAPIARPSLAEARLCDPGRVRLPDRPAPACPCRRSSAAPPAGP